MIEYEPWRVSSPAAKALYDDIFNERDGVTFKSYTYANLMIATENAYKSNTISREEYDRLNEFIYKCCKNNVVQEVTQNAVTNNSDLESAKKNYNGKNKLLSFFQKRKKKRNETPISKSSEIEVNNGIEYEPWRVSSPAAKALYDDIFNERDVVTFKSYIYANLMIATENAYKSNAISREEYDRLNEFIYKCCNNNVALNQDEGRGR